jgi:glutathionylspermidine synthase
MVRELDRKALKTIPMRAGDSISQEDWSHLRLRAIFDHCKWDPQCGDSEVLGRFPLLLEPETAQQLSELAERLTSEALAAENEILANPRLLATLSLPAAIRERLKIAGPEQHRRHIRVMRFDFHYTTTGWQISEVNADVPGGYVEACGWNGLFAEKYSGFDAPCRPTKIYADAICEVASRGELIALAHATVYSEDRQVMVHLGRELESRGVKTCLVSPKNLKWRGGRATLSTAFAVGELAAVVRLSPGEWLPSMCDRSGWEPWFGESTTPLSNPGKALVLQSKRFPLVWDELKTDLTAWRTLLPQTVCPSEVSKLDCEDLVVKPAFGRVGEDVAISGVTNSQEYSRILRAVRKRETDWIAQKRFQVVPVTTMQGDVFPCVGVYAVNGKVAGFYGRAAGKALIDEHAFDVAVLVRREGAGRLQ